MRPIRGVYGGGPELMGHSKPGRLETAPTGWGERLFIVDFRITDTLSMHNQPPKSPLSGGLQKLRAARSYW